MKVFKSFLVQVLNVVLVLSMSAPAYAGQSICAKTLSTGGRATLDLSALGLPNNLFVGLGHGDDFFPHAPAFVCESCGTSYELWQITEVPDGGEAAFPCQNCPDKVSINQKNQPPAMVIHKDGQNYVMAHTVIQNKQVAEFFGTNKLVGCTHCGVARFEGAEECPSCGQQDTVPWGADAGDPVELDYYQIMRRPELLIEPMIRAGIISPQVARQMNLLPQREISRIARRLEDDGSSTVEKNIRLGFYDNPFIAEEVHGYITREQRREALHSLIVKGELDPTEVIERGWAAKGWVTSISPVPVDESRIASIPDDYPSRLAAEVLGQAVAAAGPSVLSGASDFGEEDQNITGNDNQRVELARARPSPFGLIDTNDNWWRWSNLKPGTKKLISFVAGTLVSGALLTGILGFQVAEKTGAVATADVVGVYEFGVTYEPVTIDGVNYSSEGLAAFYQENNVRIDASNPPEGVHITANVEAGQVVGFPTEHVDEVYSILVLDKNGNEIKLTYPGGASANHLADLKKGDKVTVNVKGPDMFEYIYQKKVD